MKPVYRFLQTTLLGGILFLLPIVALVFILGKALSLVNKVAQPLATRIPIKALLGLETPIILAIGLILLFCFLSGLLARTVLAQRLVHGLEEKVLSKIPGYAMLKSTSEGMLGVESEAAYPVVLARFDDAWQIGLRIEEIENGFVTVFVPDAPNPMSGSVFVMAADRVVDTGVPGGQIFRCLKRYGAGSDALLRDLPLGAPPANPA